MEDSLYCFLGAIIGGIFTFWGSYYVWDQQQKAVEQQQIMEQRNIARALYMEISRRESLLNSSVSVPPTKDDLNNPNFTAGFDIHIYNNGLYFIFNKEISRFDANTSMSIFDFYNHIIDLESKIDF